MMGIGKKVVQNGGEMGRCNWPDSVLFVGVCVCGGRVGWVGIIRHKMLL